jgi:hypothetical protein
MLIYFWTNFEGFRGYGHYGHVDKFDGRDYMQWKLKIETMLKVRELWSLVDGNKQKLVETHVNALVAYTKQENCALSPIIQSLLDSQLIVVHQKTTARRMWEALAKWHLDKGLMNKLFLTRRFLTS